MELKPVSSSNVKAVGYNPDTKEMHVQFSSGGTYAYHGISPEQHDALVNADSIGKHLRAHIQPKHAGVKLPQGRQ